MGKIELKPSTIVYSETKTYKIIRVVNFHEVIVEDVHSKEQEKLEIKQLSSTPITAKTKNYIENYSEKEWNDAKTRYEIIKDLVFKSRTKKEVQEVATQNNFSVVTIYQWIRLYEQTSEVSLLASKISQRGKRGTRLSKNVENIIIQILEELYLNKQKYSFRRIYTKINRACKQLNLESPHENTVRNRIEAINPKIAAKKRLGHKVSMEKYSNFEGEFPEGKYPLEVVQIDHTPLDIIVVDKLNRQPLGRPYLTLAIDVYSRVIAGVHISLQSPGYYNVSQCLLNIFSTKESFLKQYNVEGEWNIYGIPRIIHVDNGADLVSSDMQKVCDEFGITLMKRPVARPQFGGHVERVLQTINFEIHNLSGTTFSNITEKGIYDSAKEATFTIEELTQWVLHYIVNIYHKTYHHGIEMTPNDRYIQGIFGDDENPGTGILPSIIDNLDYIKIALLPTYHRTVQKDGITLDGITYYSDVLRHWIGIGNDEKSKIKHTLKRDPLNIQKIYFYDPELKEYFEIPYRKMNAPTMTLWDMYASKKYLKENKISNYTEDDIFSAYEVLENLESKAKEETKKQRLKKSKPLRQVSQIKEQQIQPQSKKVLTDKFDSLFNNIKTFDVFHKAEEDE